METVAPAAIVLLTVALLVWKTPPALRRTLLGSLGGRLYRLKASVPTPFGPVKITLETSPAKERASSAADANQTKRIESRGRSHPRKKKKSKKDNKKVPRKNKK